MTGAAGSARPGSAACCARPYPEPGQEPEPGPVAAPLPPPISATGSLRTEARNRDLGAIADRAKPQLAARFGPAAPNGCLAHTGLVMAVSARGHALLATVFPGAWRIRVENVPTRGRPTRHQRILWLCTVAAAL